MLFHHLREATDTRGHERPAECKRGKEDPGLVDAAVRLLPGVLGTEATLAEESFADGLLEYPHYTRPQVWEGHEVPAVLTSGHHGMIRAWRRERAEDLTRARRPDLWAARQPHRPGTRT